MEFFSQETAETASKTDVYTIASAKLVAGL